MAGWKYSRRGMKELNGRPVSWWTSSALMIRRASETRAADTGSTARSRARSGPAALR